jgi:hypothetical protein
MGQWASATEHKRYMAPVKTRRLCWCGCRRQATHSGLANGMALTAPLCELAVRRWVKTGEVRPVHSRALGQ